MEDVELSKPKREYKTYEIKDRFSENQGYSACLVFVNARIHENQDMLKALEVT